MAQPPRSTLRERLTATHETIKNILAAGGTPGAMVAIAQGEKTIHETSYGYRDVQKGLKPDSKTLFGLASVSKSFTSAAVCILVHEGKLDWSTPIKQILPNLNSTNPQVTEGLTVHDLLTHQTGLSNMNEWWFGSDAVILVERDQELDFFNALRPAVGFREKYHYNNWGYSLIGVIVEKLSGMSFSDFLQQRVIDPLNLQSTTNKPSFLDTDNLAQPYAAMDDASSVPVPQPAVRAGTVMAPAQGVRSNTQDLLKWGQALMTAARSEAQSGTNSTPGSPLKFVSKMMSRQVTRKPGEFEKSYAMGFYRNELPTTFEGVGPNSMFTRKMPLISAQEGHPIVVSHVGTMAGYFNYLTMIPELDTVMVILTNAIPLGDPAGWVNQYLLEILVNSPTAGEIDFVALAHEAASAHANSYRDIAKRLEKDRKSDKPARKKTEYIGRYRHPDREWFIDVREHPSEESHLQVAFQGLDSQAWTMYHYEADTWLYLGPRNEEARRSVFTYADENDHKLIFGSDNSHCIDTVTWPMDPMLPPEDLCFVKVGKQSASNDVSHKTNFGPGQIALLVFSFSCAYYFFGLLSRRRRRRQDRGR